MEGFFFNGKIFLIKIGNTFIINNEKKCLLIINGKEILIKWKESLITNVKKF